MEADRTEALIALLGEAERAHGAYEATELNGVYDEGWPRWYADYAVEHGIADLVGHEVPADRLAELLGRAYGDFQQLDPEPAQPWAAYIAHRIVAEL